eukprot:4246086-Pyramimonas_sp.AAC.1
MGCISECAITYAIHCAKQPALHQIVHLLKITQFRPSCFVLLAAPWAASLTLSPAYIAVGCARHPAIPQIVCCLMG